MPLTASPLGPSEGFNWVFLIELLVCGILALFFLFYFNRLFATVVSYAIRAYTWHRYRAYIDITALQISLLGGRVFFKSIRYHAHNITAFAHDGHITWRYWLGAVQEAQVFENDGPQGDGKHGGDGEKNGESTSEDEKKSGRSCSIGKAEEAGGKAKKQQPCRISIKVAGVEAFVYNHSPLYDSIIDATLGKAKDAPVPSPRPDDGQPLGHTSSPSSASGDNEKSAAAFGATTGRVTTQDTDPSTIAASGQRSEVPSLLRMLPVRIECRRAAAAVGNEFTTSVITAKLDKATGTIDAGQAASPLDLFKLLFDFEIENVTAQMKPNRDFKQLQREAAQRILREKEGRVTVKRNWSLRLADGITPKWSQFASRFRRRRSAAGSVRTASMKSDVQPSATLLQDKLPGASQWHGLARYLKDMDADEHGQWREVEYAKSSTLIDCPRLSFRFYWDIPGKVPTRLTDGDTLLGVGSDDDINGSRPPDYGLEFGVHGGFVVYGPWADRQRVNLQHMFFPAQYVDAEPHAPLKPGDTRLNTVFKIHVVVEEDVTLRVPTREPSKDDQWQGRGDSTNVGQAQGKDDGKSHGKHSRRRKRGRKRKQGITGVDARPYGWLDITVKPDSVVNYFQDMYPRSRGFRNSLDLDVKGVEMTSSVNHGLLWRSNAVTLDADLSYPLCWNALRRWPFNIKVHDLELFILRDHMFLIIDMVNDWSSGPPPEFYTFVPFYYDINMEFKDWCMYLNVNDANIINDPADFDLNDYVTLEGRSLRGAIHIPLEYFRPKRNEISFEVLSLDMGMRMLNPPRSTLHTLIKEKRVADLPKLTLFGSFDQCSEEKPGLINILRFDINSWGLNLRAHGQLIRLLINVKENFFGDYIHFKTLEEFQHAADDLEEANAKTASLPHPQEINEMDVILCIVVHDSTVLFPTNLYAADRFVRADVPHANLDLRIVSYYLDMTLNLSPISILTSSGGLEDSQSHSSNEPTSSTQLFVGHMDLHGHRAFGLPPNEPAYVSQWDINVGNITGECSNVFVHDLVQLFKTFPFAFTDGENALPVFSPNIFNDITFVQVRTGHVRLWVHIGGEAIIISALPVAVDTSDWANDRFSQRINVLVPRITLACVDVRGASRQRLREHQKQRAHTYAFLQTGAVLDVVIRKRHFKQQRQTQQAHDPEPDQDADHTSVLISIEPGIRAYVEPNVLEVAAEIMDNIIAGSTEDVMDAFQLDVMGTISGRQKARHGQSTVLEIHATLPSAQLRVSNPSESENGESDQANISITNLRQMVRVRNKLSSNGSAKLPSVSREAMSVRLDDLLAWVVLSDVRSVHASVRDADVSIMGTEAQYLGRLALRILSRVRDTASRFQQPSEHARHKLLLLMYTLTQHSESINDPPFMSRMTFILRAFQDHFRNQDSWKVLARFRHILQNLPDRVRQDLEAKYKTDNLACPGDASAQVLQSWAQWRNWDVINIEQALVFRMLYSQAEAVPLEERPELPLTMTVRSDAISVSVKSGSESNMVMIEDMSLGMDMMPPTMPTGLMLVEENERTKSLLQIHTSSIGFTLDWSIYHLVDGVVPMLEDFKTLADAITKPGSPSKAAEPRPREELGRHDFHIVLSTDDGNIILKSINLRHLSRAEGLKMSLIGTTALSEKYTQAVCALINVDRAVTELHGLTSCIWRSLLTSPSVYVDHLQPAAGADVAASIVVAVAYNELEIAVTEQLPGILHLVDAVIIDEVSQALELVKRAMPAPTESRLPQASSKTGSVETPAPNLNVALLAGKLEVEVSLLQALSYHLEGTAASLRLHPSLRADESVDVDFDVGRLSHAFVNRSKGERHDQGLFEQPPINGHVDHASSSDSASINVAMTVEKLEIDAAALQGILSVVNKPEVRHVLSAVQANVKTIQDHVAQLDVAHPEPEAVALNPRKKTLYSIRFALLGVRIAASTPRVRGRSTAEVEFGIGPLHAVASNRSTISDANPLLPEIRALVQDIGARLWVDDRAKHYPCGKIALGIKLHFNIYSKDGSVTRQLDVRSDGLEVNAYPDTAPTVVDVVNHMQDRLRDLDVSHEIEYLKKLRDSRRHTIVQSLKSHPVPEDEEATFSAADLLSVQTTVSLTNIQISWLVDQRFMIVPRGKAKDAVLTLSSIEFTTHGGHEARLSINNLLLQLAKKNESKGQRALNSALLPEVGFSVGYWTQGKNRSLAFKATGKPLDLRLQTRFIVPVNAVQRSVEYAVEKARVGAAAWQSTPTASGAPRQKMFDTKRLASLLVEADFAGAQVYMQGVGSANKSLSAAAALSQEHSPHSPQHGRYGQFASEGELMSTTLQTPGIALKVEYNTGDHQPRLNGELRIDASNNMLLPNFVPLMVEVSKSVKEVIQQSQEEDKSAPSKPAEDAESKANPRFFEEESIITADPAALFGKMKVDLGLRICRQEFGLSCQPIARVDAKAVLDDFYFTMNTIETEEYGHFFAMSAVLSNFSAQVKHVYSREPTFSFIIDSVVLSAMNSKHLSGVNGISAILKVNPTKLSVNGKQLQDLLLFREVWLPPEIRDAHSAPASAPSTRPEDFAVHRYQLAAAAAAFPWNATITITELNVDLDLGQSIGKTSFVVKNLWASQQKSSNWEQNLCVGLEELAMTSTGRVSGLIRLTRIGVRTSIQWPHDTKSQGKTPLIQASLGFGKLRAKAAFEYQAFAFGDIEGFDFLMYNVREGHPEHGDRDRLVAVLDCSKAYVFCTSTSSAQAVGLYQAFDRLIQEKQVAYMQSLRDIEKHVRRESVVIPTRFGPEVHDKPNVPAVLQDKGLAISLHTDVVVTLGELSFGVYPSTFFDTQLVKLEANNIQARFAANPDRGRIHSALGITLGQLQVGLPSVRRLTATARPLEVSVDDVVGSATNAKGGTILRVPKVVASMQTWQTPDTNSVDYIFKSLFAGKIDVGWNLSRVNFIQGMWTTHTRALASRLGRSLPQSAVKISAAEGQREGEKKEEKIMAEVNLPQSRYEYQALEPPVIETPQLRDMGEATPPLEWIGLHRDRLPNVTHQIVIVSLLEVVKEVEDAYGKILGTS
ncbi:hypothetical protein BAUCODRAFT_70561 [Baudoinia panamericana UAMH 10762]|uniref:Elongation factor 2 n=1 Tax=Baudoinia panamericana (strain UAMH 10762) TaxID=717646 RepID=M2LQV4_BAUPA|nr:uncharacterized protein BAUCODRAFT_70561 [Baudoinia panamericana UAMH 10762]EMC96812.1 hypothetical protein BAUCODRAFT_70561 [Baudoinia panamericana UAMH 10762]